MRASPLPSQGGVHHVEKWPRNRGSEPSARTCRHKVETGDPTVAVGIVFEVAASLGIQLFSADRVELSALVSLSRDRLALLPAQVRGVEDDIQDDF